MLSLIHISEVIVSPCDIHTCVGDGTPSREYGRAMLTVVEPSDPLMQGVPSPTQVWMSHGDTITSVPDTYQMCIRDRNGFVPIFENSARFVWNAIIYLLSL